MMSNTPAKPSPDTDKRCFSLTHEERVAQLHLETKQLPNQKAVIFQVADVLEIADRLAALISERDRLKEALQSASSYIDAVPMQPGHSWRDIKKVINAALSPTQGEER